MFVPDDGPYYDFYSTGQLKVEGFMENGYCKYQNIYTKYGTLEKEYIYDEDSSYVLKSYYSNGKIKDEYTYDVNDTLNGRFTKYRITGIKESAGFYHNGLKYGNWKHYNSKGKVISDENYRRNRLHGTSKVEMCNNSIQIIKYKYGYLDTEKSIWKGLMILMYSLQDRKYDNC